MTNHVSQVRGWLRVGLELAWVCGLCCATAHAQGFGQTGPLAPERPSKADADRVLPKATTPPVWSIPVEQLGFSAPGALYLGERFRFASLDFLDENRLLFTFRVPGLMRRDTGGSDEHQIRALVLALPAGTVQAEALWTLHDRGRYLWMLKDGHFLLRDRDGLQVGNAALDLKPFLQFPGPLEWLDMDPAQQFLVSNSREPSLSTKASDAGKPGLVASPATAEASIVVDGPEKPASKDMVVRILRRDSGQVMLISRARTPVHLPINSEGYLESLRSTGSEWLLNLNFFNGGSRVLGRVQSACSPSYDFLSQREVLVTSCNSSGAQSLVALSTGGRRLWEVHTPVAAVWPLEVIAPNGSRLARETLAVNHPVNAYSPLSAEDIKGQVVQIFNAADGKVAFTAPATPVLDAGGNVAISPSGRRVAVINAGAIQIFELPEPPPLPDPADAQEKAHSD